MRTGMGITLLASLALATPVGSADKDAAARIASLEQKLEEQTRTLETLTAEVSRLASRLDERFNKLEQKLAATGVDPERETRASAQLDRMTALASEGRLEEARKEMETFQKQYAGTKAAGRARSLESELSVLGKPVPASFGIQKWFQGDGQADLSGSRTTLVVFWEVWCGYCKAEVPKLNQTYAKYKDRGLQVVGLTRITKGATEEAVAQFLHETGVAYPVAKENGEAATYFNVAGIPAAAVIRQGKVVWRGHPARLSEAQLEGWL